LAALAAALGLALLWWFSQPLPSEPEPDYAPSAAPESVERVEPPAPKLEAPLESAAIAETAADSPIERSVVAQRPEKLKVTVVDSDLAPILGATVAILSEEGKELCKDKVGFDGACVIHANGLLGGAFVQALAARYFDAVEPLDPFATELRIVLEDADYGAPSTISGYVQRSDGVTVGAGFNVLLRRSWRTQPTADDVLGVLAGGRVDGLQLTQTDANGKFSFQVHSKVSLFQLHAGAAGWALPSSQGVSDGTFTGLRVQRIYGAKLRLLDGGAPARVPSGNPREHAKLSLPDPRRRASDLSDAVLVLGGARRDDLVREPHVLHYVFTSEVELPVLGPQSVELKLPGYAPATIEFDATPIETGFSEVDVPLVRTTAGFATLSVIGSGASDVLRAELSKSRPPVSMLLLRNEAGESQAFPCELSFTTPVLLEGVPYGAYRASYFGSELAVQAPEKLVIEAPTASLNLSLANYGLARVTILDRNGLPVRGSIDLPLHGTIAARAVGAPRRTVRDLSLSSSPPATVPLEAGEYTLEHDRIVCGGVSGQARFTVRPGECTEVEIELGP
jgi:hypothetical protein